MCNIRRRFGTLWSLAVLLVTSGFVVACADPQSHPDAYVEDVQNSGASPEAVDACASPKAGCPCAEPGVVVDCGRVTVKVDNYETCFDGGRLCQSDGTWGNCEPDQVVVASSRQVTAASRN